MTGESRGRKWNAGLRMQEHRTEAYLQQAYLRHHTQEIHHLSSTQWGLKAAKFGPKQMGRSTFLPTPGAVKLLCKTMGLPQKINLLIRPDPTLANSMTIPLRLHIRVNLARDHPLSVLLVT